ncbi:uncharacterized protein UTRI_00789 [Ustilago trichophora]|uniref:Ornithine decarboxylase antizyme n=1 Tax=Ustilago trichophora TaxID=86804 RepID=A0A5C3DSX5_9BASI|nr:uncharacterized protein UTRI_00789 [Ustilago trichophora]
MLPLLLARLVASSSPPRWPPWSSGGPDVLKAEMPGSNHNNTSLQHPGRSAPVRGVASQQASTSFTATASNGGHNHATTASSSLPQSSNQHAQQQYTYQSSSASNHPLGWDRPYSSGLPAPAVAVPIFRAAHAADMSTARFANPAHLPDSPPDTPPQSPGLRPTRLPSFIEPQRVSSPRQTEPVSWNRNIQANTHIQDVSIDALYTGQTPCDSELESNADTDFSDDSSQATLDQLTQAAQSLLLHSDPAQAKLQHYHRSHEAGDASISELMPATPEISPDNNVRHHAQKSAHAFLHRIFAHVPHNLAVEDAGVELVSPGWSGAVIKSGPVAAAHASSSYSSTYSTDSSADTQRTLYVSMPPVVDASLLREQVLAVLDAASEKLGCDSVMVCLDKAMRDFASVLHGLCYVGGALVAAAKETELLGSGQNKLPDTDPSSGLQLRNGLMLVAIEL